MAKPGLAAAGWCGAATLTPAHPPAWSGGWGCPTVLHTCLPWAWPPFVRCHLARLLPVWWLFTCPFALLTSSPAGPPPSPSVSLSPGLYPPPSGHPPSPRPWRDCHPNTPPRWHGLALGLAAALRPTVLLPSGAGDVTSRHAGRETRCLVLLWLHLVLSALPVPPTLPAGPPPSGLCEPREHGGLDPALSFPAGTVCPEQRGNLGAAWGGAELGQGRGWALLPRRGLLGLVEPGLAQSPGGRAQR